MSALKNLTGLKVLFVLYHVTFLKLQPENSVAVRIQNILFAYSGRTKQGWRIFQYLYHLSDCWQRLCEDRL